ncbi:MAG: MetQ/NlpA family ABC transporter substrate-binding protein [Butyrivibrio sp.]|nr:MetQ/NlpA family ABC transporter substrate-binding protein [Butyrivibrio sp.]
MKKSLLTSILLSATLAFGALTGCGDGAGAPASTDTATSETAQTEGSAQSTEAASTETKSEETPAEAKEDAATDKKITVGATPVPHAEILDNVVAEVLSEEGWELETVVFSDYVLPNTSLEEGELDANYFQTLGYMNQQNADAGLHLAAVAGVHIEPMGIYSQKYKALSDIPDGASIGIPNDPDNGERAVDLLVQKGLLTSKGGFGSDANYTEDSLSKDKDANPHGYVITPLEAASLPLSLPDLDAAAINGNYALEAGLPASYPALDIESFDDETTVKRTNFLVVKQGNETSEKTQALIKALQSDKVQEYIDETYKGAVITSFIDAK